MHPLFCGASLIALHMKGGGVRPTTVGHTLHHLAAMCAGNQVLQSLSAYSAQLQLG